MTYPFDLTVLPPNYTALDSEPAFDAAKHLALEAPDEIFTLADFGYTADEIASCPSDFAATSVFRVLSDEGAGALLEVCKKLEAFTTSNPRIQRNTRGGVYRSKFLRDLCLCSEITDFMSRLAGLPLMPHTIPHQLGHLNYAPKEVGADVDKWHVDTLRFDYVMFVTDPTKNKGGAFQYFKGTKHEMATLKEHGQTAPLGRVIAPQMPGPGYAIMQQGNMVVHQAKGLQSPGERITMVNGYIAADPKLPDYTRYDQLIFADPPDVVTSEYMRHVSFLIQRRMAAEAKDMRFSTNREKYAQTLDEIMNLLHDTIHQLRHTDDAKMEHF